MQSNAKAGTEFARENKFDIKRRIMYIHIYEFEWDFKKATTNQKKHGVSFEDARSAFDDPDGLDGPDFEHSFSEPRFLRIANSELGRLLTIVYTIRSSESATVRIRIISARNANHKERKVYAQKD